MDAARWERIKSVFQEAFEHEPAGRARFLDAACGGDADLRASVDRLLEAHASAGAFLDESLKSDSGDASRLGEGARAAESVALQETPTRIGQYRVIRELGRGGMGAVYLAERDDPGLRKTVAIKVVRRDSHFMLRRFRTESQILSGLEHPGIARLYDGGTTDEGLPFFVMEYVAGENIVAYCDAHHLSIADRLRLFRRVCDAVQFAHQSFIVHRDLKPSNILVTADAEPKLLDFGIAKLLNPELAGGPVEETMEMTRLLTPQYASPEHVRGQPVTTASDVYSLGVILYELLTGARPYRVTSAQSAAEIERAVCETDAPLPSSVVPANVRRALRGDLDNIVLKALRKAPSERYATAAELAEDIRRQLEGYPVQAQPDRVTYRASKFVRRHRAAVIAVSTILVAVLAGTLSTARQLRRAERRFADVRSLAHSVLFDVYDSLSTLPNSLPTRRLVVSRAQEYLDSLAGEAGNDSVLVRDLAASYMRLGDVRGRPYAANLGDTAGARDSYQKAIALLEQEDARRPNDPAVQEPLCEVYMNLGRIFSREFKFEAAIELLNKAIGVADRLAARFASEPRYIEELARATMYLGSAQANRAGSVDGLQTAVATYRRALALQLAGGDHPEEFWQRALSWKYFYLGYALLAVGDYTGDASYYREALDNDLKGSAIRRRVAEAHPDHDYRRDIADALVSTGGCRWKAEQDLTGAMRDFREALAILQALSEADTTNLEARRDVAGVYQGIGATLGEAGRRGEGVEALRKALAIYEEISRADPNSQEDAGYVATVQKRIAALERDR